MNACLDPLAAAVRTVRTVADEPKRATGRRDARSRQPERPEGVPGAAVRIKPPTEADVASAVELAVRVLRVKPGDRGEQFAADITGERWQMFVAKADQRVVAYGRVLELAPTGCSM